MNFLSAIFGLVLISLAFGTVSVLLGVSFLGALKIAGYIFAFLLLLIAGIFFISAALVK